MSSERAAGVDSALGRSLAALHEAADLGQAAEAALAVLGADGRPASHVWLEVRGIRLGRSSSGGSGGAWLDPAEAFAAAEASVQGAPVTLERKDGTRWDVVPVPGAAGPAGVLAARAVERPRETLALAAAILGAKIGQWVARQELERERERNAGWFKTLDDQIRILEGERQKLSVLVNKTDAAVFVCDPEGTILWVNPVMARWYQDDPDKGRVGTTCRSWCGVASGCEECPIRSVREGSPLIHQERTDVRGQEIRHLYVSSFPVRSPEGRVNAVLTMLQDITDLETLRRSQARYQLLFERSADAMVMAHPDSLAIVMANRQARQIFGISPDGEKRTLLDLHPGTIRASMESHYIRLRRGRTLENLEVDVVAAGGGVRTVNACGTLFDLDGSEVILVEFRDVTHLRELQAELARADHLITLGTMNAGIAHEFKNRLAPLRAFAQLLTKETLHLPRVLAHAPLMIQEIDRLTALVRDVLDYARPQSPVCTVEDLGAVAADLTQEFREEFSESLRDAGIRCVVEPGDDRHPVWIDASQLRRAFLNLFKNAVEAMEGWSGEKTLTIGVRQDGDSVQLVLADTGPGMDRTSLCRVFDPFYTTKGPRGTGLGMCITKSLIEANGGGVEVTSQTGRGTQVILSFPLAGRSVTRDAEPAPLLPPGIREAA